MVVVGSWMSQSVHFLRLLCVWCGHVTSNHLRYFRTDVLPTSPVRKFWCDHPPNGCRKIPYLPFCLKTILELHTQPRSIFFFTDALLQLMKIYFFTPLKKFKIIIILNFSCWANLRHSLRNHIHVLKDETNNFWFELKKRKNTTVVVLFI